MFALVLLSVAVCASSCSDRRAQHQTELRSIYHDLAKLPDDKRNPVIVIPGILGSKLVDSKNQDNVWGEFSLKAANPLRTESLTDLAIPMQHGVPLRDLGDTVVVDGPLDEVAFKLAGVPIQVNAYGELLSTLGVGGYRDRSSLGGKIDYSDDHFTCFQFAYDWRRDISESAAKLADYVDARHLEVQQQFKDYGFPNHHVRFDIVAHSMGGLVARYYLRYGRQPLSEDGSLPKLTWEGAAKVDRLVLVGTPNAGAAQAIKELTEGMAVIPGLPKFPSAVVGTMPAVYQLLPRTRHRSLLSHDGRVVDVLDSDSWSRFGWGLADPKQDAVLQKLLPKVRSREDRRHIALEHQRKCLARAQQLHQSLDRVASPPPGLEIHLFAGDAEPTLHAFVVDTETGKKIEPKWAAGDGTVMRSSALSEDVRDGLASNRIPWTRVTFISSDHLGMTKDRSFVDNVLFTLLQSRTAR